jgi:hypothetical protein
MSNLRTIINLSFISVLTLLIFGCGGGGSQDLTPVNSIGTATTGSASITKVSLAQSENTTVSATFTRADGTAVSGVSVAFTTTLGTITPATVITDAQGKASTTLMAGATAGQGQITASATYDGKTYVKTANFQVALPVLHLSAITLGAGTLSYGGTTSVSVSVRDANNAVYTGQEVDVYFTSTAAGAGTATITSPVRTVSGVATTTFKALTFTGTDTITATISGSSVTNTVTVTPLSAGSITYVSATPTNLALKGTGGIGKSEVSTVVFKVLDSSGAVRPNTTVDFVPNTTVGGITLSSESASSGSDGTVSTQVLSGIIATPVRVTATVRGTTISTQSEQLVISTGLPSQDGFSISIANLSPESWNVDGVTTAVTARLSDHFHNPVPDGTTVYFTTSGGSITPSCTTTGGACSVTWTSQNPRPRMPNAKKDGRAVILAYAIGEEAFVDLNGNGLADPGEFTDTTGAFRDDNENGIWDSATEPPIPFFNATGFEPADGKYNGVLQGTAYIGALKSKHVFSNSVLVMATSAAQITGSSITVPAGTSAPLTVTVNDLNGNTMPAGTTVEFGVTTTLLGNSGYSLSMPIYDTYTVPNNASDSGVTFTLTISDMNTITAAKGYVSVKVTSPAKLVTKGYFNIN